MNWQRIALDEVTFLGMPEDRIYAFLLEDPRPGHLKAASHRVANRLVRLVSGSETPVLRQDSDGKPYIPDSRLQVSLSHSGACLVVALGTAALGVDIEYLRYPGKWRDVYRWINRPMDRPPFPTEQDFLACWTAKESLLKLLPGGFGYGVQRVRVPRGISTARRRVEIDGKRYYFKSLPPWKRMTICLAMTRPDNVEAFYLANFPDSPIDPVCVNPVSISHG